MAAFTSGYPTFALAVAAANTTPPGLLVVDTACSLAGPETISGSLTFAGGSISLGTYNLTITQLIGTLPAQQQFIQLGTVTGAGILSITAATPPYTLEQFGGGTGVYDNANAFYRAFNWMNSTTNPTPGGILYLGAGTYQTSTQTTNTGGITGARPLTFNSSLSGVLDISNITVQGSGREATTIKVVSGNPAASTWLTDDLFPVGNISNHNSQRYTHDVTFCDLTIDDSLRVLPVWLSDPIAGAPVPTPWTDYWAFGGNVQNPDLWAYMNGICQTQPLLCPAAGLLLNGLKGPPGAGGISLGTSFSKVTLTSSQGSPAVTFQIAGTLFPSGTGGEILAASPGTLTSVNDYTAITSVVPIGPAGGGATNTIHSSQAVNAGNLSLSATPVVLGSPAQQVTFYNPNSSISLTGVTFTIYGTNVFGLPQTEAVPGPSPLNTAISVNFYSSVWQITANLTVPSGNVELGATAWSVTVNSGGYSLETGGSNPTSICLSQPLVASTALSLNGTLSNPTATTANLASQGQQVVFTSAFDLSGVSFTIAGNDAFGNVVTETVSEMTTPQSQSLIYGYGISTFSSIYSYASITNITPGSFVPAGATVSVGTTLWGAAAGSGPNALNAICQYQTSVTTALAINGTLSGNSPPTAQQVTVPSQISPQNVTISSQGDMSGYTFTIGGTPAGETIPEGPKNGTVLSKNQYSTVTGITSSLITSSANPPLFVQVGLTTPRYQVGNILTVYGGTFTQPMQLVVTAVQNGAVLSASISQEGSYTAFPSMPFATTGGHGIGASFSIGPTVQVGVSNIDNVCQEQPISGFGALSLTGSLGSSIGLARQLIFTSTVPLTGAFITIGGTGTAGYNDTGAPQTGEGPISWPHGVTTVYSSNTYTALATAGAITYSGAPSAQIQVGTDNYSVVSLASQRRRNVNCNPTTGGFPGYGTVFHFSKTDRYKLENIYFKNHHGGTVTDSGCRGGRIVDCVFDTCGKDDGPFQCLFADSFGTPNGPSFCDTEDIQVIRPVARNCNWTFASFAPTLGGKIIDADIQNIKESAILLNSGVCTNGGRVQIVRPKIYNVVVADIEGTGISVAPGAQHVDIIDSDIQNTNGRWVKVFGTSDVDIHGGRALNNGVYSAALLGGIVDGTTIVSVVGGIITLSQPTTAIIPASTTLTFYPTGSVMTVVSGTPQNSVMIDVTGGTSAVMVGMLSIGNGALSNGAAITAIVSGTSITVSAQTSLSMPVSTPLYFYLSSGAVTTVVTGSAATPIGSTTISFVSGAPMAGMASVGNALIPGNLINTTYPYGPYSEGYATAPTMPLAGSPRVGIPVLMSGISTTPMQNVRIRDVDFENTLYDGTTVNFIEVIHDADSTELCEDFFFEDNNIRNMPYDTLFWTSAASGLWDPEMSLFIENNRGHSSQAPVIVQDSYAAYDLNPRQYNLGFRPSEIEITMQQTVSGGPISSSNATQIWNGSLNGQSTSASFFIGLAQQLATVITHQITTVTSTTIVLTGVVLALQPGMVSIGNSAVGLPDGVAITAVAIATNTTITISGTPAWQMPSHTSLTFYTPHNLGFYGASASTGTTGSSSTPADSSIIALTAASFVNVSIGQMSGGNSSLGLPDGSTIVASSPTAYTITVSLPTTLSIPGSSNLSFFSPPPFSVNPVAVPATTGGSSTATGATAITLASIPAGLKVRMVSIGNPGLSDGTAITAINSTTSVIDLNLPTIASIGGSATLNFYNPGQTQTQSMQGTSGQITNSAGTVVNTLSIGYWEQGVVVTPTVNVQAATYQFLFRP